VDSSCKLPRGRYLRNNKKIGVARRINKQTNARKARTTCKKRERESHISDKTKQKKLQRSIHTTRKERTTLGHEAYGTVRDRHGGAKTKKEKIKMLVVSETNKQNRTKKTAGTKRKSEPGIIRWKMQFLK